MVFGKKQGKIIGWLFLVGILVVPFFSVFAGDAGDNYGLDPTATAAYGKDASKLQSSPVTIMGTILGIVLASLGVIFMIQIVMAGVSWMTAQGNEEKVTKAKDTMMHAVIGLIIVVGAYALVNFVLQGLLLSVFK